MVENNLLVHPRERLPHCPVPLLDTRPEVNFQRGRFFIYEDEFEFRVSSLCSPFLKIKAFAKFVRDNHKETINQSIIYGDLTMFSDFFEYVFNKGFCRS